ncbi:MAG: hypothetical protein JSV86_01565 [Gemmatimonadota bacterium]|nr:MAG: hypothetical protein JSV86_01565 [Gemmatimonadota bacterium]
MRASVILAVAVMLAGPAAAPAAGQSWRTEAKARQYRGQEFLDVKITYAVGRFELRKGADHLLYRLDSRYDEDAFDLRSNYLESEGRGSLRIEIDDNDDIDLRDLKDYDYEAGNLTLDLTGAIPLALDLEMGAVEAQLDLGGLKLRRLSLQTGASDTRVSFSEPNREAAEFCTFKAGAASFRVDDLGNSGCRRMQVSGGIGRLTLDFSGDWDHDATGDINVGLGTVQIRVPAELGVRIEKSTFLMSFDAPGFEKQDGGVWLSRNWDTAEHHLTLSVSGVLGGVEVDRI